jgi:hypothetical protein
MSDIIIDMADTDETDLQVQNVRYYNSIVLRHYADLPTIVDMSTVDYNDPNLQYRLIQAVGSDAMYMDVVGAYGTVKARLDFAAEKLFGIQERTHKHMSSSLEGTLTFLDNSMRYVENTLDDYTGQYIQTIQVIKHSTPAMGNDFMALSIIAKNNTYDLSALGFAFEVKPGEYRPITAPEIMIRQYKYSYQGVSIDATKSGTQEIRLDAKNTFMTFLRHVKDVKVNVLKSLPVECNILNSAPEDSVKSICFLADQEYITQGTPIDIKRCFLTFELIKQEGVCPDLVEYEDETSWDL